MTDTLFTTPNPEVRIRLLTVSAVVAPLDNRTARSRRPDGTTAVSLARLRVLVSALEHAGYRVCFVDEGARR